jgi:glycosyltransferase involved in cell wall biosynthesis
MRVLMISNVMPHKMTTGGEVCTQNYIDAIRGEGHELDLIAYSRPDADSSDPPEFHSAGVRQIESGLAGAQAYWWLGRAFLTNRPYGVTKYRSSGLLAKVRELGARNRYACTIIDHTQLGWVIDQDVLPQPCIFSAHNVESKLYSDQAAGQRSAAKRMILAREARLLKRLESKLLRDCRQTWVLTAAEQQAFATAAPGFAERIRLFDLPGKPMTPTLRDTEPDIDVGMMGNWLWEANRDSLAWFINDVVPSLPSNFRIHVAGKGSNAVANPHANVVYEGFVENSVEFLRRCKVVVIPSLSGAGVQLKTIEVISAGIPTISTPVGLRGINQPPAYVDVAETGRQMSDLVRSRVLQPMPPDFAGGARWTASRSLAFRTSVRSALAAIEADKC